MNRYEYADIMIGHTETFTVMITDKIMSDFCNITGDSNPAHTEGKLAYGMLTASFISTLAGMYLPGEHSLIHKIEAEFPAPVYAGDTLVFTGEVVKKDDNFKTIELKVAARNNSGKKVFRGKMRIGVLK